jgi:hypothetical protein
MRRCASNAILVGAILAGSDLLSQQAGQQGPAAAPPKNPDEAVSVFKLPSAMPAEPAIADKPATVEPPKPKRLEYAGQPLTFPFTCTEEDIQIFGMTCTEREPCPVYVEISAVQALGLQVFLTGNFHNGAQTLFSLLAVSDDGGKSWFEPHERIRHATLDQVQFADFETGWISGQVIQSLPRDPFFLLTTDGGKNWRQRPIYGEPKIATIEQFHFESRKVGNLLIEAAGQWERWESQTGGESWMVREVSNQPLKLRAARQTTSNADWRLRAEAKLKAHILEKREGGQFRRVSAFSVEVAKCQPEVKPLAEPPPLEPAPAAEPGKPAAPAKRGSPSLRRPQ